MFPSQEFTYYSLLEIHPSASVIDIRRAYWELSKLYHPDTTKLPANIATDKFRQINQAYATLSHPQRRLSYDRKIGYFPNGVIQAPGDLRTPVSINHDWSKSADLDPGDRPLSDGEIFALFILGLTLVGCLLLAMIIGMIRGESSGQIHMAQENPTIQQQTNYDLTNNFPLRQQKPSS